VLDNDRVDPSRRFARVFYRSQLEDANAVAGGLLRHFLTEGLAAGLWPSPDLDPIAAYRQARPRTFDVRDGLRHLALAGPVGHDLATEPPAEGQAKTLFAMGARALLPGIARAPLEFGLGPEPPVLSAIMVVHNQFALTMAALASLRANFPGPIQLILVDSGSSDETTQIRRYLRGAEILRLDHNVGFLRGCNAGLRFATAEALLFLNNDIELAPGALDAALARLRSDPAIGAVGAKLVRTHGLLQEAGCIIWRDGWTIGYLRDASPLAPEANFVRDVDYCSAAFLLTRTALVHALDGFDEAFAPAYYEDADLCLRIQEAGHRVVYDPAVQVRHLEYGSSASASAAAGEMAARHDVFVRKHIGRLRFRYTADTRAQLFARSATPQRGRVLFIEDQIPLRRLGQGFVRSNDIVRTLADLGHHVTVYPLFPSQESVAAVYADMPDTVEAMYDRSLEGLEEFLKARRGYYDTIWICRTHNLDRVKPILERGGTDLLAGVRIVLDTEAIAALREAAHHRLNGKATGFDVPAAIRAEFANAWFCQSLVAVSESEAAHLRALGFPDVAVLGHLLERAPTPRPFAERAGMLFVGALPVPDSPNLDALQWFAANVLPLVEAEQGYATRLTVAANVGEGVDLSALAGHPRITLCRSVADLAPLYDRHRVVVAPARFAAGIPYKVHEAAAMGVPMVASELLREQVGWENGRELLSAPVGDAEAFARAVLVLQEDAALWERVRKAAGERVARETGPGAFAGTLREIMGRGGLETRA
jgi:GT2 family glycosyltransferase/glycosyltransferase involved in cell wall biosynthesis